MKRSIELPGGITFLAGIILLISGTSGCSAAETPFGAFRKVPDDRPVISSGSDGWPAFMADPCVFRDEEGYHAFFTNLFFKRNGRYSCSFDPRKPEEFEIHDHVGTVAYAFSSDRGLTWTLRKTPCVMPGPEPWCDDDLETPFVVKDGDRLVMFYSALGSRNGKQFRSRYQIGAATLELGNRTVSEKLLDESVQFAKRKTPVLPYNTRTVHHDNNTQEPSVVVKDGMFELYYTGLTLKKPDQQIPGVPGQGISKVALYKSVLDKELNLVQAPDGALIKGGNIAEVHYHNGAYHAFLTESPPWYADYPGKAEKLDDFHYDQSIAYSRSADGKSWSPGRTILEKGPEQSFDNWGIMAPTVVFEKDRVVMFYTAWQIADQTMNPLPPDGRFGMSRGQSQVIWGTLGRAEAAYLTDPSGE